MGRRLPIFRTLLQLCALLAVVNADFYKLLGISRNASLKQIKKAYRQKSLEFHPDKNKEEGASDKFAEIARAYEVLSDEDKKSTYDKHGEEGLKQQEARGGGGGGGGFEDLFSQFGFGGGGRGRRDEEQRTPSVELPLELTLEQLYKGVSFDVEYIRQVLCLRWEMCMKASPDCQGPGIRIKRQQIAPGFVQQVQQRDERCIAPGKMWTPNCSDCPKTTDTEKIDLTVDVTKGMRPMERVTFEGVTDEKPGYKPGDLNFVIVEKKHKEYHRDGDHLYKTMEIPLVDALVSERT
jgi:DnaJ-class molecular chaperone